VEYPAVEHIHGGVVPAGFALAGAGQVQDGHGDGGGISEQPAEAADGQENRKENCRDFLNCFFHDFFLSLLKF